MTPSLARSKVAVICCMSSFAAFLFSVAPPSEATSSSPGCPRAEEFNGAALDPTQWDVFHLANTKVLNGQLVLAATFTERADIQSTPPLCRFGTLTTRLSSANLVPNTGRTDSSTGFEIFAPGGCHYSVQLVHNGHLGLLRSVPDAAGNCHGDPALQAFIPIPDWDVLRSAQTLDVTIQWAQGTARLTISGGGRSSVASYTGREVPDVPMRVRLNQDFNTQSTYDYVRGAYGS